MRDRAPFVIIGGGVAGLAAAAGLGDAAITLERLWTLRSGDVSWPGSRKN